MAMGRMTRHGRKTKRITIREKAVKKAVLKAVVNKDEKKFWLSSQEGNSIDFSGEISQKLVDPTQGNGFNQRIGDVINLQSIKIRGTVLVGSTTNYMRIVLFRWRSDSNLDIPAVDKIFGSSYTGSGLAPYSPIEAEKSVREKFTVLGDKFVVCHQDKPLVAFNFNRKLNTKVYFNRAGQQGKGHIYMAFLSDDGAITYPAVTWVAETVYTDP